MLDPKSAILSALYHRRLDEADALAAASASLTLWEAAALGRDEAVRTALDRDPALVNAFAPDGHTALGLASFFGRPSTVRLLLDGGADVRIAARNEMKVQPLHAAIAGGSAEAVQALLTRRPDVNARQQLGYTALMGAASAGREDLLDLLLEQGADTTLAADDGQTAAQIAGAKGHASMAAKLEALTNRSVTGR